MKTVKTSLAALAIVGFAMAPMAAQAGGERGPVEQVGCTVLDIITLPIRIFTGEPPKC